MVKFNTFRDEGINHWVNNADVPDIGDAAGLQNSAANGSLYLALHTAWPGRGGSQNGSEASYTGYARKAITRDGTGFSVSSGVLTIVAEQLFGENTGASAQEVRFWTLGVASSGATKVLYGGHLAPASSDPREAIGTASSDNILVGTGHGLAVNDEVVFYDLIGGASLPGGISEGTIYFVISVSTDTIQISTTLGGGALNITSNGAGLIGKVQVQNVKVGDRPRLAASTVLHKED